MITLRFVTAGDLISRAIRGGELGFWASHVECRMPDGTLLGAHADGGVASRPADYDKSWTQQMFVDVPCRDDQAAAFHAFLLEQVGKPYDMEAICELADGFLTGEARDWSDPPSWICSALQTASLLTAGIIMAAPAGVRLATPRDVLVACAALVILPALELRTAA